MTSTVGVEENHKLINTLLQAFSLTSYTYSFKQVSVDEYLIAFSTPTRNNPIPATVVYMKAVIIAFYPKERAIIQIQFRHEKSTRAINVKLDENNLCTNVDHVKSSFSEKWITSQLNLMNEYFQSAR